MTATKDAATRSRRRAAPVVVDLFAGCGGLSLGLEMAGFRTLMACEVNEDARNTYLLNRKGHEPELFGDILDLTDRDLTSLKRTWQAKGIEEVDLLVGGPPCQGFSGMGHRRSYSVPKREIPANHLYLEMARVIRRLAPRMFLFENVRGLLTARWTPGGEPGEIWTRVRETFFGLKDYHVRLALVQAKDYGVPQNRPRVLIVGVREDVAWIPMLGAVAEGLLPEPSGVAPALEDLLSDLVDPNYLSKGETTQYLRRPLTRIQHELRTRPDGRILEKGDSLSEQVYSKHRDETRAKFLYMIENGGRIAESMRTKKFGLRLLPRRWDEDRGPIITATSLPDDYVHYAQPRIPTVREWARIQTFPDWYQFAGSRMTGGLRRAGNPHIGLWSRALPKYTQIGNGVPVLLARRIGEHFAALLAPGRAGR